MKTLKEVFEGFELDMLEEITEYGIPGELSDRDLAVAAATAGVIFRRLGQDNDDGRFDRTIRKRIEASNLVDQPAMITQRAIYDANGSIANVLRKIVEKYIEENGVNTAKLQETGAGSFVVLCNELLATFAKRANDARSEIFKLIDQKEAA